MNPTTATTPTTAQLLQRAADTIEMLCNGIRWRIENRPMTVNNSDDEALAEGYQTEVALRAALETCNPPVADGFHPHGIAHLLPPFSLTVGQLWQALELGGDESDTELCFQQKLAGKDSDGDDAPAGIYCWMAEYPEEGSIRLDPEHPTPAASNPLLVDACRNLVAYLDKNPPMGDSIWSIQQIRGILWPQMATDQPSAPDQSPV